MMRMMMIKMAWNFEEEILNHIDFFRIRLEILKPKIHVKMELAMTWSSTKVFKWLSDLGFH